MKFGPKDDQPVLLAASLEVPRSSRPASAGKKPGAGVPKDIGIGHLGLTKSGILCPRIIGI